MAGSAAKINFASRQSGIPACRIVYLKFNEGNVKAEYVSGSEYHEDDDTWSYSFLVQEEDLPGGLTLADIKTCNIIAPYWTCVADEEAAESENACETRTVSCFQGLPVITELENTDMVAILRYDAECDTYCLVMITAENFKAALDALVA